MKIEFIVSSGQYETSATKITKTATTLNGFIRVVDKLKREYETLYDNWGGWHDADVAIASRDDVWGENDIIGGRWCQPKNGWISEKNGENTIQYYEAWEGLSTIR